MAAPVRFNIPAATSAGIEEVNAAKRYFYPKFTNPI